MAVHSIQQISAPSAVKKGQRKAGLSSHSIKRIVLYHTGLLNRIRHVAVNNLHHIAIRHIFIQKLVHGLVNLGDLIFQCLSVLASHEKNRNGDRPSPYEQPSRSLQWKYQNQSCQYNNQNGRI